MADTTQVQGLPPGAVVGPDLAAPASQVEGLPPGAVVGPNLGSSAPAESMLSKAAGVAGDVATGFAKGAGDTVSGIGHLINKIPVVGETLSPSEGLSAMDTMDTSKNTAQSVGKGVEDIAEFAAGDEALDGIAHASKLVQLAQKYPLIAKTLTLATEHPWLAKIITEGAKGAGVGAVQGTVKGAQQGQAVKGAETGAASGAVAGATVGAIKGASSLRVNPFRAVKAVTATPEAVGEAASQPIAQAGVRAVAPPVGASFRSGIDVQTPFAEAKALYHTIDDAAKTDFKGLYDKLDAAQDDARLAAPGSPEEAKAQLNIKNTQDAIDDAKKIATQSGVPDVDKTLAQADAKYTETQANKDLNKKIFSENVITGNVKHNTSETFDVDKTISALERMDEKNKFGVSRLRQTSLGDAGADKLKQVFYDAQKAGKTAMDARALRNTILKWGIPGLSGALGLGYELTK